MFGAILEKEIDHKEKTRASANSTEREGEINKDFPIIKGDVT